MLGAEQKVRSYWICFWGVRGMLYGDHWARESTGSVEAGPAAERPTVGFDKSRDPHAHASTEQGEEHSLETQRACTRNCQNRVTDCEDNKKKSNAANWCQTRSWRFRFGTVERIWSMLQQRESFSSIPCRRETVAKKNPAKTRESATRNDWAKRESEKTDVLWYSSRIFSNIRKS